MLCTLNCASVPEEVRAGYGMSREEISALAEAEPVGCEGLSFIPYLAGERTPNWPHASGALVGIRAGMLARPGLIYRAALEGATFSLKAGLRSMNDFGVSISELRLVGGGSKSDLWRRIIADAVQSRVACPTSPESAAIGAALQACAVHADVDEAALGSWIAEHHDAPVGTITEPDGSLAEPYNRAFELYEARANSLFGGDSAQAR